MPQRSIIKNSKDGIQWRYNERNAQSKGGTMKNENAFAVVSVAVQS